MPNKLKLLLLIAMSSGFSSFGAAELNVKNIGDSEIVIIETEIK